MKHRVAIIGAASMGLAVAAALREVGVESSDVLVLNDERDVFGHDPIPYRPLRRAPRSGGFRQQFGGVIGLVLNSEPALATFTSEKPLTKRQRRRARGKSYGVGQ